MWWTKIVLDAAPKNVPTGQHAGSVTRFDKILQVFGIFLQFISYLTKCPTYFCKFVALLEKFSWLCMAKYWNIILPSGHTARRSDCLLRERSVRSAQQNVSSWVLHELYGQFLSLPRQKQNKIFKFIIELVADLT